MNRTKQRQAAFEIIFSMPFNVDKPADDLIHDYTDSMEIQQVDDYVVSTVRGVKDHLEDIDAKIAETIKTRKFERLDNVCLSVLRLAVYEMIYNDEIPVGVAVNEATELIKLYDDSLTAFINGNLRKIANTENE